MNNINIPSDFFDGEAENAFNKANSINIFKAIPLTTIGWKPRSINRTMTISMLQKANAKIIPFANDALDMGYRIYAVCQRRGHCHYSEKVITVPTWAIANGQIYTDWYLAHELSHAFAPWQGHNQKFMQQLKKICPIESIHLELTYKKREALAAGIMPSDF